MTDLYTLLDEAPESCEAVASLYDWSTNFDGGKGPITLFLDLIGYSADEFGELYDYDNAHRMLGYVELDKLGLALREYADRPSDVRDFVEALIEAESNE